MSRIEKRTVLNCITILMSLLTISMFLLTIRKIKTDLNEQYQSAISNIQSGNISMAADSFNMLGDDYRDAKKYRIYAEALMLFDKKEYSEAKKLFDTLGDFEESRIYSEKAQIELNKIKEEQSYNKACKYYLEARYAEAYTIYNNLGDYEDSSKYAQECKKKWCLKNAKTLSAGIRCSAGITSNGSVVFATKDAFFGKADILNWDNIISVSACGEIIIGLKSDGTVVSAKRLEDKYYDSYINMDDWTDIVAVSAGQQYVIGLRSDGTVAAESLLQPDGYDEIEVGDWANIVAIDTAWQLTAGLDQSGNIYVTGYHAEELQNEIEASKANENGNKRWTDIVAVSVGGSGDYYRGKGHIVGLTKDGRVVAVGDNDFGQCDVDEWKDEQIIAVSAGDYHTVALTADGRVLTTQKKDCHFDGVDFSDSVDQIAKWEDIVAVSAGYGYTLGLKSDGTVVAVGNKNEGQADVSGWHIAPAIA